MSSKATPHGLVTRSLHWVSAALLAYGYYKGLDSVSQLADPTLFQFEVIFALVLGAVFLARMVWTKAFAGQTRLPDEAPQWEHRASWAVHISLYLSVYAIVLSGLGIAFGVATPARTGVFTTAMIGLHEVALTIMPLLLIVHIAGALWHKLIRRDGVMESITGSLPV